MGAHPRQVRVFISYTFNEQQLKDVVSKEFKIVRESLYRYY